MYQKFLFQTLVAASTFTFALTHATNAVAVELGPYVGVGVGAYTLEVDDTDFDDNDTFVKALAGWRITENFAIEGDFQKLAESKDDIFGSEVELEADTWSVVARPILPLTDFLDLYGRVGWAWYDVEATSNIAGLTASVDNDDNAFTWGAGVDFHLGDTFSIRGEASRIEIDDADLNLVSAAVVFRF